MITGGAARNLYATTRVTYDVDVVVDFSNINKVKFKEVFKDYYISNDANLDSILKPKNFNATSLKGLFNVDFFTKKNTKYAEISFLRRVRIQDENLDAYFASIEDLILTKLIWNKTTPSELQIKDINELVLHPHNKDYVKFWCKQFKIDITKIIDNYDQI